MRQRQSSKIHTQQYVPLEDRVFAYSIALFTIVVFLILQVEAYIQNVRSNQQEQQAAILIADLWNEHTPENEKIRAYFSQPLPPHPHDLSLNDFALVPATKFRAYCYGQKTPCIIKTSQSEFIFVENPKHMETDTAIVVPRASIDAIFPSPLTQTSIILLSASTAIALAVSLRLLLRSVIFSNLDKIIQTVFARRVFEATGSIAKDQSGRQIDGRIHVFLSGRAKVHSWYKRASSALKGKKQQNLTTSKPSQTITLTHSPEPPRMPLEEFSNDELGKLALALEEDNQKFALYEKLFEGLLNNIPVPIIATSRDGHFFMVNQRFREVFPTQDQSTRNTDLSADIKLRSSLAIPEELIASAIRILDQKSPRVFAKEYTFRTPTHDKLFPVSITTLSKFGKRIALISIHENLSTESETIRHALWSICNQKLDLTQAISNHISEKEYKHRDTVQNNIESIIDLLNTELDILHGASEEIHQDIVEFSLQRLFSTITKNLGSKKIELILSENLPDKIIGSPSHIKHFLLAVLHNFFQLNICTARIFVSFLQDESILEIAIRSSKKANRLQDHQTIAFLKFLSRSYQMAISENQNSLEDFIQFSTSIRIPENKKQSFTVIESLKNKKLITVVASTDSCQQPIQIIRQITSAETVFHDFPTFRLSNEDFSLYDAAIVLAGALMWQKDQDLLQICDVLKENAVPILLIPQTPRRGDSAEATRFGFSGYLRRPFSLTELQEILFTLCNKDALSNVIPKGIITRYAARELAKTSHSAIISILCEQDWDAAQNILTGLNALGIQASTITGAQELIKHLFENPKDMVFYPSHMTAGQRRQLAIAAEGHTTFAYESTKVENEEKSITALQDRTVFIRPPFTEKSIANAIHSFLNGFNKNETTPTHTRKRRSA